MLALGLSILPISACIQEKEETVTSSSPYRIGTSKRTTYVQAACVFGDAFFFSLYPPSEDVER